MNFETYNFLSRAAEAMCSFIGVALLYSFSIEERSNEKSFQMAMNDN